LSSVPALIKLDELNSKLNNAVLYILVKVKISYTAYAKPPEKYETAIAVAPINKSIHSHKIFEKIRK
jgi:hypothetical protein